MRLDSRIILFILFALSPLITWGQVSFSVTCDQKEVTVGQRFEVVFSLRNAKIVDFTPPSLTGFEVVGNTQGQTTSFINGKSSMIHTINYALVAKREGTFKIGQAAVITHEKKSLKSKALKIKVVAAGKTPTDNLSKELAGKVFIRTEVSNENPVVGEQVMVDIKIYTQINVEQLSITKEPAFDDFFSHYLRSYDGPKKEEVINGKRYTTKVLRRIVVFPSKSGPLVVEPAIVDIGVPVNGRQSLFNPFSRLVSYSLKSMPVELNVKALDGAPANFSGVVGKFKMQTHVERNQINSDDVIQLKIQILGEGDIKQVLAPKLGVSQKYFDEFDPNSNEDMREGSGALGGKKIFDYVLTPKVVGDFTINPKFVYFDIERRKFITLDTTIQIRIQKGKNNLPTIEELAKQEKEKEPTLVDKSVLMEYKTPQNKVILGVPSSSFLGSILFWLLMLLPLVGLGAVFYQKQKLEKIEARPDSEVKKQNAGSEASKRLKNAKSIQNQGDAKAFYNEISKALLGFVGDKYNIPTVDLTKNNVKQLLTNQNLASDKIDNLMTILQTCEMALFAGLSNSDSMQKVYQDSEELIKLMEG